MSDAPGWPRDPTVLRLLRCPVTGAPLRFVRENGREWLSTEDGSLRYPVRGGVPSLLPERAERPGPGLSAGGP